jgi:hypothetical protein
MRLRMQLTEVSLVSLLQTKVNQLLLNHQMIQDERNLYRQFIGPWYIGQLSFA